MPNEMLSEGDVVQLQSGGPDMTIREIADGLVTCEWFDKGMLRKHEFKEASLGKPPERPGFSGYSYERYAGNDGE